MTELINMTRARSYSSITKSRAGAIHDKSKYWKGRYNAFLKAGFSEEEASWGCRNGLSLRSKQVKKLMAHRKNQVKWRMEEFHLTWGQAVDEAAKDLEGRLDNLGEDMNLFKEISP